MKIKKRKFYLYRGYFMGSQQLKILNPRNLVKFDQNNEKKRRNQFLARYMQMLKSYSNLKISKF